MRSPRLSDIEIQRELNTLDGWSRKGESLVKTYEFATFLAGIKWMTRVADAAEAADHHPDLDVRYTKITAQLTTHDSAGITERDFALAREMDRFVAVERTDEPA